MLNLLFFHAVIVFNLQKDQACANFNVNLYLCLACLQIGRTKVKGHGVQKCLIS